MTAVSDYIDMLSVEEKEIDQIPITNQPVTLQYDDASEIHIL